MGKIIVNELTHVINSKPNWLIENKESFVIGFIKVYDNVEIRKIKELIKE